MTVAPSRPHAHKDRLFGGAALAALMLFILAACAPRPQPPAPPPTPAPPPAVLAPEARLQLTPVTFDVLPGWPDGSQGAALPALTRSCRRYEGRPASRPLGNRLLDGEGKKERLGGVLGDWQAVCAAARRLPTDDHPLARAFFEAWFRPYLASANGETQGLFTGYYEAQLHGSLTRHGPYQTPILAPPPDLVSADLGRFDKRLKGRRITGRISGGRLVPYATRGEIDAGALGGRGLEILWVDNPVDAFFLHVQGSGRVILDTGQVVRLGFANRNGHPYRSIGRELIRRGDLPRNGASMWAIRDWVAANPDQAALVLAANPSYIFFRVIEGEGPIGAQGVALTPEHSLAVDPRHVPLGLPLWVETVEPGGSKRPLRRLMVTQDTGSAIKGPVRGDFFWGYGKKAARSAGTMKSSGRYFLLIPKSIAP